jgi:hypothetical protein
MLPDSRIQADFSEKPIGTKRRASDGTELLEVVVNGGVGNKLVPEQYDHITLSYNVGNYLVGVVYRTGGAGGTVVATLVLTYDGANNLISVARA